MDGKIEFEDLFFCVLDDLNEYLDDLTLVGGWLAYVYPRYLWHNFNVNPVTTLDIDFGVRQNQNRVHEKTIFQILSNLDYTERHIDINRMYPVVLFKEGKIRIDFISATDISKDIVEQLIGNQISLNKLPDFEFLLKNLKKIDVRNKKTDKSYSILCPKPSAFIYHKAAVFVDREDELKQAKDLFYIYFILRYSPDLDVILKEFRQYYERDELPQVADNLKKYFQRNSSQGCLMVEKENGPDSFINDLRADIFERFRDLILLLK